MRRWLTAATTIDALYRVLRTLEIGLKAHLRDSGDVLAESGLILKSANGHYWRIGVSDAGALSATDLGTTAPD